MIPAENKIKKIWDVYILLLTTYFAIEAPARLVLGYDMKGILWVLDQTVWVSFLLDVLLNFLTLSKKTGSSVRETYKERAITYLKGWFTIDFVSAIPFDLFTVGLMAPVPRLFRLFRLLRLLRLLRVAQFIEKLGASRLMNPVFLRLFVFLFWIGLMAHWIGCGWIALGGCYVEGVTMSRQYIRSFYYAVTTLTTIGYGDITPVTNAQTIFAIFVELIGAGLYGYIIGNVASLLANIDVAKAHFSEKIDKITAFLNYRNVPPEMKEKVMSYYDYLWNSRLGYDESAVIEDLPPSLRTEVSLFLNKDIIEKVPLFKGASHDFIREIVNILEALVFTPGDFIIRKGEIGDEMFFISQGAVEVVSEDGKDVYAELREGSYFGEIALINSEPRTASIRASEYCDIYTLGRDDLDRLLIKFPEVATQLRELADKRIQELKNN